MLTSTYKALQVNEKRSNDNVNVILDDNVNGNVNVNDSVNVNVMLKLERYRED